MAKRDFLEGKRVSTIIHIASIFSLLFSEISLARDFAPAPGEQSSVTSSPIASLEESKFAKLVEINRPLLSDEYIIEFPNEQLGLRLKENDNNGVPIVIVKEVLDRNLAIDHPELLPEAIVVEVNGEFVGSYSLKKIANRLARVSRPVSIKFRDPTRFFLLLDSSLPNPRSEVSASFLPANSLEPGSPEQIIKVERLSLPSKENRRRAAAVYDVLEIQYDAEIEDSTGKRLFVDGSSLRTAPGSSQKTIYYVLGEQNGPPGKFPKGWDIALKGMVIGEVRRITLPYSLAYGLKGNKELNIPPRSNMIYTVKLISLT